MCLWNCLLLTPFYASPALPVTPLSSTSIQGMHARHTPMRFGHAARWPESRSSLCVLLSRHPAQCLRVEPRLVRQPAVRRSPHEGCIGPWVKPWGFDSKWLVILEMTQRGPSRQVNKPRRVSSNRPEGCRAHGPPDLRRTAMRVGTACPGSRCVESFFARRSTRRSPRSSPT
jgi:hypothetical protein